MSLNLERLAEALNIDTSFSEEDRCQINNMREQGTGLYAARDEIFAGKILKRINELVNKLESEEKLKEENEKLKHIIKDLEEKDRKLGIIDNYMGQDLDYWINLNDTNN